MKKKGFTLIELLAVIVVLAVIALISVPIITGMIDKARRGAFKSSVLGIMDASELYVATHTIDYNDVGTITFTCNGESCLDVEGNKLAFKGEVPTSGTVIVNKKGLATVRELTNGKYCITGERTSLTITKDCKEQVLTPPIVTVTGEEVENSGYYLNQKASIVFDSTNTGNPEYFIKTTKNGISNISVTEECGDKANPSSCNIVEETTTLNPNVWYKVSDNVEVTYNELSSDAGTIVAIMKDGDIYINSNVESVGTITIETNYTVNHYQMNIDGETYTLAETENLTGYAYINVTPNINTYEGFTSPEVQSISILPDGTSVVDYYYTRNKYIIKYEANGGEGTMEDTICTYGVDCTIRANAYTLSGYAFNGWTGSDGGSYTDGQSVTNLTSSNNAIITMTANWQPLVPINTVYSFSYTGSIQQFEVPIDGIYKLYLIGGSGGAGAGTVGNGGITTQYLTLQKGTILYVVVGGAGGACPERNMNVTYSVGYAGGGYNGGGSIQYGGGGRAMRCTISGGGGATHVATISGVLSSLSNNKGSILAVAGGGGGYDYMGMDWYDEWEEDTSTGGSGGGLNSVGTIPATQTSGYAFGQGAGAGGGGWFGGQNGNFSGVVSGGSGYLSDSTTVYTINGVNYNSTTVTNGTSGGGKHGSATITLIGYKVD